MPEDAISILSDIRLVMEDVRNLLTEIRDLTQIRKKSAKDRIQNVKQNHLPELAKLWNEYADNKFLKVIAISEGSKRGLLSNARWLENSDATYWKEVIQRINKSEFCHGKNDRGWIASFDFLIRPDTRFKALEGKYDNRGKSKEMTTVAYLSDGTPVKGY